MTTSKSSAAALVRPLKQTAVAFAVAAVFGAVSAPADAAGLGRLTVQSALGQPLKAQVEVTSLSAEESSSLTAKLASSDAFRQAGLEFNPALTGLRFAIKPAAGGRSVVEITSNRPINEPFVDLLVELNWATGKFVREYTFLLDPPELRLGQNQPINGGPTLVTPAPTVTAQTTAQPQAAPQAASTITAQTRQQAAQAVADANRAVQEPSSSQPTAPVVQAQTRAAQPQASQPAPVPTARPVQSSTGSSTLQVQRGDTLGSIARALKPSGVTLDQAMVAIYRANPSAFFGSIHQLRAGTTLTIPSTDKMASLSTGEVQSEIRASNQTWREYRARLAAASSEAAPTQANAGSGAVGSVTAEPTDTGPATPSGDQLKLSRDDSGAGAADGSATGSSDTEAQLARESALTEAQSRVTELERNVSDLQRLLELKNKQLADLSDQLADTTAGSPAPTAGDSPTSTDAGTGTADTAAITGATETGSTSETATGDAVTAPIPQVEPAGSETMAAGEQPTSEPTTEPTTPSLTDPVAQATDAASQAAEAAREAAASAASSASEAVTGATQAITGTDAGAESTPLPTAETTTESAPTAPTETTAATQPDPVAQTPAPVQEVGLLDQVKNTVMENPLIPAGALGLLALGGLFAWRRKKSSEPEERFEDTLGGDDAFAANSLFGTTGGQDVDTNNSVFQSEDSAVADETAVDVHSTEVDPIAEAEVYIAYGREAQAEEILKEALKRQPDRQAIRLKLLEIYAGRKDASAFSSLAREMYDQSGGQNEEWPKVITMGLAIDPENSLYTGDPESGDAPVADAQAQPNQAAGDNDDDKSSGIGGAVAAGAAGAAGMVAGALSRGNDDAQDGADAVSDELNQSMDFDVPDTLANSAQDAAETVSDTVTDDDMGSLDFDLDINTEMAGAEEKVSAVADTATQAVGDDAALGEALRDNVEMPSLDIGDDAAGALDLSNSDEPDAIADLDIPSLDTITNDGSQAAESDQDLSAIGLDLTPTNGAAPAGSEPARWQEMATKLDLASAYEEIGDKEGARELLDEVIKGGDNAQQQKARAMLSKIS